MLLVVWWLLFILRCLLSVVCWLPFVGRCLLAVACCSLFVVWCLLHVRRGNSSSFVAGRWSVFVVVCCLLKGCALLVVRCVLLVACCSVFGVR